MQRIRKESVVEIPCSLMTFRYDTEICLCVRFMIANDPNKTHLVEANKTHQGCAQEASGDIEQPIQLDLA
jgi:hypothetical protein